MDDDEKTESGLLTEDCAMEPKIKAIGGYWYVWDDERSQYIPTGIKKANPKDDPKRNDLTNNWRAKA